MEQGIHVVAMQQTSVYGQAVSYWRYTLTGLDRGVQCVHIGIWISSYRAEQTGHLRKKAGLLRAVALVTAQLFPRGADPVSLLVRQRGTKKVLLHCGAGEMDGRRAVP